MSVATVGSPRLGFDIGGTFTDLVLVDDASGKVTVTKVLTTPAEPSEGVAAGIRQLLGLADTAPTSIGQAVHGATTLITNTIIERSGAPTALLTTRGFRDVLEIGREWRYDIYDLFQPRQEPLVPRHLRFEVRERIGPDGEVMESLALDELEEAAAAIEAAGARSVAICFLNAYANAAHEEQARSWLRERLPRMPIITSSEIAAEIREYERTSTTVACAYVAPRVSEHLERLETAVRDEGVSTSVYVMHSSGGIVSVDTAARFPIKLIESGPAAGVLGAAFVAEQIGETELLSFDMGGTTAKICCIDAGQPALVNEFEAARLQRFRRGSGIPLLVPVIDLTEIGAGGGSIGFVDGMGLLKVGPRSAGASPGPVAYARGGTRPTVTDADLLLGYLDPDYFLGGEMQLDVAGAESAVAEALAGPLGIGAADAAAGVVRVVNDNMANAAKIHLAERGRDPRRYTLVAFGGAGGIHGVELARALGIGRVIYPLASGALSALGLLTAPVAMDFQQTAIHPLVNAPWPEIESMLSTLEERARNAIASTGAGVEQARVSRAADMRYTGQGYSVTVPLPEGRLDASAVDELARRFADVYGRLYGSLNPDVPLEITTWRILVQAPGSRPQLAVRTDGHSSLAAARKGSRRIFDLSAGVFREAEVYDHYRLPAGARLAGPAVVEQHESTCILAAGDRAVVGEHLNVRIEVASAGA